MRLPRSLCFMISGLLLAAFVANMALRIARIKFGAQVASFGDVGEFMLVLWCMVFFVAGLLLIEAGTPEPAADNDRKPKEEEGNG